MEPRGCNRWQSAASHAVAGEDDLARGVQDRGEGVVGGRCHGPGDALVGGAAHDVCVRALEKVELRRVVGLAVFGQVEAELPKLGALVGKKAVERLVEHRRYQLPHDQTSLVSGRPRTVLATGTRLFRAATLAWPRRLWPVAIASDATAARKSSVPRQLAGCAEGRGRSLARACGNVSRAVSPSST
jgi:hypothetical protein